jgi:hypothetical protein
MNVFEFLEKASSAHRAPFLIIGGHAVNAYGYSRFTKDLDILVKKEERTAWLSALRDAGFTLYRDGGSFLQMSPPSDYRWPLDLMMVDGETLAPMLVAAREIQIGDSRLKVPSLDHLFALKFHVLKQEIPGRGYKDLVDVLTLAECNGVNLRSDRIRELCEKFGSAKIYERLLAFEG